jgi:hypothetical protein
MKNVAGLCLIPFLVVCGGAMVAQNMSPDTSGTLMPPPKVLVIEREWVKPGRSGSLHEKSEAAFVNAMKAAKWPTHYVAAESMSGRPRALFMFGYPSFEGWEKDNEAMDKNATLTAAFEKASFNDSDLLTEYNQNVFVLDSENSLRAGDAVHARYFEITQYRVKPGHRKEWSELVKLYHDTLEKALPDAHWALYQSYYGEDNGGYYVVISTMKSLSEDDASMNDDKKIAEAMGPDGMKHVAELTDACIASSQTNLFHINPRMSYADESWMKADEYWQTKSRTKTTAAPTKKIAAAGSQ